MKQKLLKNILSALFVLVIVMIPTLVMAQSEIDPGCDMLDPDCPIDGGLSALLILGAGYGIKKVRDARKNIIK